MSIVAVFEHFKNALRLKHLDGQMDLYINNKDYKRLHDELSQVQRNPQGGYDAGIILFEQFRIQPVSELESMKVEISRRIDERRRLLREIEILSEEK